MRFFLDYDVPADLARILRLKGQDVQVLDEVLSKRVDDLTALRHAVKERRVVITCNRRDFLRLARTEPHVGMIILVRRRTRLAECASVLRLLQRACESGIANNVNFA